MKKNKHQKFYLEDLAKLIDFLVPKQKKIKRLNVENGRLKLGQDRKKYDYLILNNLIGDLIDIQGDIFKLHRFCRSSTKLVITHYNHLWEPILKLASFLGLRNKVGEQNWLDQDDLSNLLELAGFDMISHQQRMLLPLDLGFVSRFINKWVAGAPLINGFCLTTWVVARPRVTRDKDFSVSVIVPARNESGNIPKIVGSIPKFGKWQEVVFVEGHSTDDTWNKIKDEVDKKRNKNVKVKAFKQKSKGKADAVRLGFKKAAGEVLMILDADLTVNPKDLPKFYNLLASGKGEFINGSRLVYPMEDQAMQTLNKLGNRVFGWLFSYLLGQRFKDTLCGTKALFKKDYQDIFKNRGFFDDFDPFGDFDLIFGAVKQNLKVVEVPVRYRERQYGTTNISRFKHGWLLLKMTWFAFVKFRVW